ncbi:hypothetical protein [Brevundimonas nasdae]|uniref:hypothetical protein n=1 Tax=Brevundimonas nasdae TaxID=172043 RepID=UPI003F6935E1
MRSDNTFIIGVTLTLVVIAVVYVVKPDLMMPSHLTCAARSADGCMVWADQRRIDRYKAGEAGK